MAGVDARGRNTRHEQQDGFEKVRRGRIIVRRDVLDMGVLYSWE